MSDKIKVEINPLHFYGEYDSCDYTLCCLDFYLSLNGEEYHFISQSSNNCISDLLKDIEKYLSGQLIDNTELCYYIPWVLGDHCIYPYSFKVKDYNTWTFRYKRNQNDTEFDFECDISKNDIISMQKQIKYQFAKIDWETLGKSELYTFDFAETEFEWCYSANDFKKTLNKLCVGHSIKKIYVSATNYFEPLQVDKNYVNYFMGSELIIQFDDFLIDLLILAEGLFKWRVFKNNEYAVHTPVMKFIEDGDEEFCDIGNAYEMFTAEYTNSRITQVEVVSIDYWPWSANGFDESKLSSIIELPKTVCFYLSNEYVLSIYGYEDDFGIELHKYKLFDS